MDLSDEIDTQYLEEKIGPTYTQTQTWRDAKIATKSAFVAFGHQYAYNVLPFGMVNSSATL